MGFVSDNKSKKLVLGGTKWTAATNVKKKWLYVQYEGAY
jgi:hypothetical protein